jgi:prevent-host-death family protein
MASKLLSGNKRSSKKSSKPLASVVSAYEAKTHFSKLLERASKGESITITKHGQEVARLSPTRVTMSKEEAVEELKAFANRVKAKATLAEIDTWKNEGRS